MFLKRIEMQGFKSFADKTIISFDNPITGVVGPNGCGKSNITDAVRWVLGEQSAKSMRGEKMNDVIFAGSADRRKLNMAEVTLVFDNSNHILNSEKESLSNEEKSIDLDFSFERKDKVQNEYDNVYGYTKEQLEHLEPWQLELVKKGEYDPSGFEEQELEDDDWHSDDEDETIK